MRYYDLMANWPRVEPHLTHPRVQEILVRDFGRFVANRYGRTFLSHQLPADFEVVDWHPKHTGPEPPFWRLVLVGGCHGLVNSISNSHSGPRPRRPGASPHGGIPRSGTARMSCLIHASRRSAFLLIAVSNARAVRSSNRVSIVTSDSSVAS